MLEKAPASSRRDICCMWSRVVGMTGRGQLRRHRGVQREEQDRVLVSRYRDG